MEKRPSDFSVVSKGYCFLCLSKTSPVVAFSSSSVTSFHDISRYLKIDMGKVFIQGGPVPPHLFAQVQRARLKVELCEDCASITENISKQCRQLEKLKMEIKTSLESIYGKIIKADETGRSERFRKVVGSELPSGIGSGMEIFEVLRKETKHKCSGKIKAVSPRLQIQKLTTKEIRKRTFRIPKMEPDKTSQQMSDSGEYPGTIKIDELAVPNFATEEEDMQNEDSVGDEMHHEMEELDSSAAVVNHNNEHTEGRDANTEEIMRKWTLNAETGKYKCRLCPAEYATRWGVHLHYNAAHRKLRFKCQICGKEFTQKGDYKRHHESIHLGLRFQCKFCKNSFTQKCGLMAHQRKDECGIGRT